ncbi:MAG TPA: hypothetical protein VK157_07480, partial [Phycisphaerales bacterium]|nr:hypothetical protein [Phycisphaerales bacterium]
RSFVQARFVVFESALASTPFNLSEPRGIPARDQNRDGHTADIADPEFGILLLEAALRSGLEPDRPQSSHSPASDPTTMDRCVVIERPGILPASRTPVQTL